MAVRPPAPASLEMRQTWYLTPAATLSLSSDTAQSPCLHGAVAASAARPLGPAGQQRLGDELDTASVFCLFCFLIMSEKRSCRTS